MVFSVTSVSKKGGTEKTMCSVPLGGPLPYENITLVYDSQQLNGTQRVLLDNVLSEEQCRELHSVASGIMLVGDGYRGKTSPHTPNEKFEGATVLKALKVKS